MSHIICACIDIPRTECTKVQGVLCCTHHPMCDPESSICWWCSTSRNCTFVMSWYTTSLCKAMKKRAAAIAMLRYAKASAVSMEAMLLAVVLCLVTVNQCITVLLHRSCEHMYSFTLQCACSFGICLNICRKLYTLLSAFSLAKLACRQFWLIRDRIYCCLVFATVPPCRPMGVTMALKESLDFEIGYLGETFTVKPLLTLDLPSFKTNDMMVPGCIILRETIWVGALHVVCMGSEWRLVVWKFQRFGSCTGSCGYLDVSHRDCLVEKTAIYFPFKKDFFRKHL